MNQSLVLVGADVRPNSPHAPGEDAVVGAEEETTRSLNAQDIEGIVVAEQTDTQQSHTSEQQQRPLSWHRDERTSYNDYISTLKSSASHLKTLLGVYNHRDAGTLCVIDVPILDTNIPPSMREYSDSTLIKRDLSELTGLYTGNQIGRPRTRLFVVEDLSPGLIEVVGDIFDYPHPELFAEHLLGSRHKYFTASAVAEQDSSTWVTRDLKKPFSSIKWYRPVHRKVGLYGLDVSKDILKVVGIDTTEGGGSDPEIEVEAEDENLDDPWFILISRFRDGGKRKRKRGKITTNIMRSGLLLSTQLDPPKDSEIPFLWEEKATILVSKHDQNSNVIVLLDPLPKLLYTEKEDEEAQTVLPYKAVRKQRHPPWPLPRVFYPEFLESLNRTNSTLRDLSDTLLAKHHEPHSQVHTDPISALLHIIYKDIKDSFHLMATTLEEITLFSTDDFLLQENLSSWRTLMNRMQTEVQTLIQNLHKFLKGIYPDEIPDNLRSLNQDLQTEGENLTKKIARCHSDLRADMSLLESRRGIAETESVTRLTELAFIFIPLTFVAGLFSMQIKEFQSGVPVTTFVKAAVIVTVLTYSFRIIANAGPVQRAKRTIKTHAQTMHNLGPNDSVSLFEWLKFIFYWISFGGGLVWSIWLLLAAISLAIVPMALLWSKTEMDASFKAVGSILFVSSGLALAWLLAMQLNTDSAYEPAWGTVALSRQFFRMIRSSHRRARNTSTFDGPGHMSNSSAA